MPSDRESEIGSMKMVQLVRQNLRDPQLVGFTRGPWISSGSHTARLVGQDRRSQPSPVYSPANARVSQSTQWLHQWRRKTSMLSVWSPLIAFANSTSPKGRSQETSSTRSLQWRMLLKVSSIKLNRVNKRASKMLSSILRRRETRFLASKYIGHPNRISFKLRYVVLTTIWIL